MLTQLIRGGYTADEVVLYIIIFLFALTLSFAFHEYMHAKVADWLGDPTPRDMGRVTLNPIAHVDPVGTFMILLLGFGWGKPVPINRRLLRRFKSNRLMVILVSVAGVTGNFILALISSILWTIMDCTLNVHSNPVIFCIYEILGAITVFSLGLLAFNLLPIPPLDGFHIVEELLPYSVRQKKWYLMFRIYAPRVLMFIIFAASLSGYNILRPMIDLIEAPFAFIISLVIMPIRILLGGL